MLAINLQCFFVASLREFTLALALAPKNVPHMPDGVSQPEWIVQASIDDDRLLIALSCGVTIVQVSLNLA